jgi:hypothetical protein
MTTKTEKQGKRGGGEAFLHTCVKAVGWADDSSAFTLRALQGTHKKAALLGK